MILGNHKIEHQVLTKRTREFYSSTEGNIALFNLTGQVLIFEQGLVNNLNADRKLWLVENRRGSIPRLLKLQQPCIVVKYDVETNQHPKDANVINTNTLQLDIGIEGYFLSCKENEVGEILGRFDEENR